MFIMHMNSTVDFAKYQAADEKVNMWIANRRISQQRDCATVYIFGYQPFAITGSWVISSVDIICEYWVKVSKLTSLYFLNRLSL